ncbi:MAG: hypothetical protein M3P49_14910, partial [Actinomycetota bacterium]|nr:hypothetical protein [Actinomycetota bacterium]
ANEDTDTPGNGDGDTPGNGDGGTPGEDTEVPGNGGGDTPDGTDTPGGTDIPGEDTEVPDNGDTDVPEEDTEIPGDGDPDAPATDTTGSIIPGGGIPETPDTPDTENPGNGASDTPGTETDVPDGTTTVETDTPDGSTTTFGGDVPSLSVTDTPGFSDIPRTPPTKQMFEYFAMSGDTQLSGDATTTDAASISGESLEGSDGAQSGVKVLPDTGGADLWRAALGLLLLLTGLFASRKAWKGAR